MSEDHFLREHRESAWTAALPQVRTALLAWLALATVGSILDIRSLGHDAGSARILPIAGFEAVTVALVLTALWAMSRRPGCSRQVVGAAAVGLALASSIFGVVARGSAEMLVVDLTILLSGAVLFCPWGAAGQALASTGALAGYPAALAFGLEPRLDPLYGIVSLFVIVGILVRGAEILDRHRRSDHRAMDELYRRDTRLRGYFDLALFGMGTLAPDRTWVEVNDEVGRILGRPPADLLGTCWDDVVDPADLRIQVPWFQYAVGGRDEARGDFRAEVSLRRGDGATTRVKIALRALRDGGGRLQCFVVSIGDLTEHRRVEEELRAAKEEAEAANRSKDAFLATMSHEIRTPMNLIFGLTEMALDAESSPLQRETLRKTRSAAGTLQILLNDVLDFSRIEAGRLEVRPRRVRVREWLEETLGPFEWWAGEKGLRLDWRAEPDVPRDVLVDGDRLRQAIVNLVSNAIKFTDRGSVHVGIARRAPDDGQRPGLEVSVVDTGVGIEPADIDRIFDAFTQGEAPGGPQRGGAGLGLAICRRLVDLMGGSIAVESQPGRGSTFRLRVALDAPGDPAVGDPPGGVADPVATGGAAPETIA